MYTHSLVFENSAIPPCYSPPMHDLGEEPMFQIFVAHHSPEPIQPRACMHPCCGVVGPPVPLAPVRPV